MMTGCASSLADETAGSAAPDWYEARIASGANTAYPRLSEVPGVVDYSQANQRLDTSVLNDAQLLSRFLSNPRSQPAYLTPSEILAWGTALKQQVNSRDIAANFLTDNDVAQLRARFGRPRAR